MAGRKIVTRPMGRLWGCLWSCLRVSLCTTLFSGWVAAQTPALQHTQIAGQRAKLIASDVQLLRLHEEPAQELHRLDAERAAACHAGANSEACKAKIATQQPRRTLLANKLQYLNVHVPQHKAGGCQGCHASPGATPARDPILPALGDNKPTAPPPASTGGSSNSGGTITPPATQCFIATAAYGSPHAGEVVRLRRFRDEQLLPHAWGRAAVALYYEVSPPLAAALSQRPLWRAAVRGVLTPLVWSIEHGLWLMAMLAMVAMVALVAMTRVVQQRRRA
jgi:hypothetical protein